MPILILVRHGNTFETGETATWVGARTDRPLTAQGEVQGRSIAALLAQHFLPIGGVMAGPLLRTQRMAEFIAAETGTGFTVDERLIELDFGLWENKSSDEIRAAGYGEALDAWETNGTWPEDMNFAPSQAKLERNIQGFLAEQHKKLMVPGAMNRVAITSNGLLRFVYRALTGQAPGPDAKVKTGAYCVLTPQAEGWTIETWNQRPA